MLEDDDVLRATLCEVLLEEGFEVAGAANALAAIQRVEESGFDLIIADIRMAGMDGLQAVEAVRDALPQIRTIVMTGFASEADSVRALRLGIGGYLRKPFEVDEFLATVQRQIQLHREASRIQRLEHSSKELAIWALEVQLAGPDRALLGLSRLARQVAVQLGLSESESQECQLLALAEGLRRRGRAPDFGLLQECLRHGAWLHQLDPGDEPQLAARIATLALAKLEGKEEGEPELAAVFQSTAGTGSSTALARSASARRRRGSLLALAQPLEKTNPAEALRIYREIAGENTPTQECVSAYLGLARLREGSDLSPALHLARQVGPVCYAQAALTLGLLETRKEWVVAAGRIFAQLPGSGACRAGLAQYAVDGRAADPGLLALLEQLGREGSVTEWQHCCSWLLPYLARCQARQPLAEVGAALLRLARYAGADLPQLLSQSSAQERRAVLEAVRGHRGAGLEAALQQWQSDPELGLNVREVLQAEAGTPSSNLLRIYSLGQGEIWVGEDPVPESAWTNRKQLYLLIYLAAFPGAHGEDVIIERLWPGKDPARGRNNINSALSHVRKVLKSHGADANLLQRDRRGLWLDGEVPHWHDLSEFDRCLQAAALPEQAPAHRQELLRQACQLYRGPFLVGSYFDWADPLRQHQENLLVGALLQLSELCLAQVQYLEALEHSQRLLELDPCCQQAGLTAMRAYLGLKRAEEAVRVFERLRQSLTEELAMEPSIALLEMHQRALLST